MIALHALAYYRVKSSDGFGGMKKKEMFASISAESIPEIGVYCGAMFGICGAWAGVGFAIGAGLAISLASLLAWVCVSKSTAD